MRRIKPYIHQKPDWPTLKWDNNALLMLLGEVRNSQGKIVGKMEALGFDFKREAVLNTLTLDVIKSTEIEGEIFNTEEVRSSLAKRLGMTINNPVHSGRDVDGMVDLLLDATTKFNSKLTVNRLFNWHCSLFPTGKSGMYNISVGKWRVDSTGPMQVVSVALGKEKVHFEAPHSDSVETEMAHFVKWVNTNQNIDPVIKAGVAHLWFVTVHPFEDGNGRISRALTDLLLARADGISERYYSMSSQIRLQRREYYKILEKTQQGGLDVTQWLMWFLDCLLNSLKASNVLLEKVLFKHHFWNKYSTSVLNQRQVTMLNKLLNGFTGKLTTSKWAKITKCSSDSALRDIQSLIKFGILQKEAAGGRSTNYELVGVV